MRKYSSHILFMLLTFLVVIISINGFKPLDELQRSINDSLCSFTATEDIDPNIVMVTIDGRAMDEFGSWPWNYDLVADLLAATAQGEPKVIVLDFIIQEDSYQDSAGYTDVLANQISWIPNLVIPYDIALTTFRDNRTNNPKFMFENSVNIDNPLGLMDEESSLLVRKVFLPPNKLLKNKPFLGFDYTMPDDDRIIRHHPTVMNFEGYYYPSVALAASAAYLNIPLDMVSVTENQYVSFGTKRKIPINKKSEFLINMPQSENFRKISAAKVLSDGFNLQQFKNKLVIVAVDDIGTNQYYKTAVQEQTTKSFITASVMQNIINNNILTDKTDAVLFNLLILFVIGGICAFALPQISVLYRLVTLFGGLFILANVNYFMFSSFMIIPNTVYITLELILFMIASPIIDSEILTGEISTQSEKKTKIPKVKPVKEKTSSAEQVVAEAEVPVRQIADSPSDTTNIKTTMIDASSDSFPDDHQSIDFDQPVSEAEDIIEKTSAFNPDGENLSEPVIIGPDSFSSSEKSEIDNYGSVNLDEGLDSSQLDLKDSGGVKQLGRYQILGTLGKGAMGHVYKGVDPAINRPVALKTIRLDFVNDPEELEELKERLFREAQAAGKMSHPNIVTIYDVGSEGHLQYIAMEYLEGKTLEEMIKKKTKFNFRIIAKIIMQICDALEYAHDKGIVHRDIKPANIMVLSDYTVKLMDYGIARIDSNSMTKTGIAMGTPNYISPEQLKGQTVDKRADLFSLGVVIYELLLGKRPFKGENITSLIYSVMNHEPEKPSNLNPQIPLLFDHIINKALKKETNERYQKASDLKHDLADFVESFTNR